VVPTANSLPEISEVRLVPGAAPYGVYQALDWLWERPRVYETSMVAFGATMNEPPIER
jgi:hypothetical protein